MPMEKHDTICERRSIGGSTERATRNKCNEPFKGSHLTFHSAEQIEGT